jgi:F0F1-type ATP synthase membrane subunit b/b'
MDWINANIMLALNLLVPAAIIYFIWRQIKNMTEQRDAVVQHLTRKISNLEEKVDELLKRSNDKQQ